MPKQKTRKAVVKRFKVTSKKKVLRRKSKQNHFNARQSSDQRRNKKTEEEVTGKSAKNILTDMVQA
jgi:ribosomal protein L35